MTEVDNFKLELALQFGFNPHEDGDTEDGSDDTYVVKAVDLVKFIKLLSLEATLKPSFEEAETIEALRAGTAVVVLKSVA